MKKDIFDEIINSLRKSAKGSKTSFIPPEIAKEFFTDIPKTPAEIPVQNTVQISQQPKFAPAMQQQAQHSFNTSQPQPPQQSNPMYDDAALAKMSFEKLANTAMGCQKCPLAAGRTNVVFGEGAPQADLMFIGEGPGFDEDMQGRPFVGKAGQLLTKMINAMQFSREEVYIANIVKCRPPKNRNPLPEEAAACLPYLKRQIELINPKVIVVLGAVPLKFLLNKTGIMRQRGNWDTYNDIKVMPTFHPAYLLRNPDAKRDTWNDLQQVMQLFGKFHKK